MIILKQTNGDLIELNYDYEVEMNGGFTIKLKIYKCGKHHNYFIKFNKYVDDLVTANFTIKDKHNALVNKSTFYRLFKDCHNDYNELNARDFQEKRDGLIKHDSIINNIEIFLFSFLFKNKDFSYTIDRIDENYYKYLLKFNYKYDKEDFTFDIKINNNFGMVNIIELINDGNYKTLLKVSPYIDLNYFDYKFIYYLNQGMWDTFEEYEKFRVLLSGVFNKTLSQAYNILD